MIPFVTIRPGIVVNLMQVVRIDDVSEGTNLSIQICLTDGQEITLEGKEAENLQTHLGVCQTTWLAFVQKQTSPLIH